MIKKYVFGTPFPTNAVVTEMETAKDKLPFLETDNQGTFNYALSENDIVYGLGEQIRGINKRGWQYVSLTIPTTMRILVLFMALTTSFSFAVM